MAWFTDEADLAATDGFEMGTVEIDLNEGKSYCSDLVLMCGGSSRDLQWEIENQGSLPVYLRVTLTDNSGFPLNDIEWTVTSSGWYQGNDEYWYYQTPVDPDQEVDVEVQVNASESNNEYLTDLELEGDFEELAGGRKPPKLNVKLQAEAIQEAHVTNGEWPEFPSF